MSSRFPSLCLAAFLIVGAFVTSTFGQSPGKKPSAGNDPERPVQYISLQQAFEMAMKNEPVCQQNQIAAEQVRILKPLPTGGVCGGVVFGTDYGVDQTETRISTVFTKAAEARKAGKTEVARAYYESIRCLYPESKRAEEATWRLELLKAIEAEAILVRGCEHFGQIDFEKALAAPNFSRGHFWFLEVLTPLTFERINGATGP